MALTVGSRLGHYDVTALIGEGGMGQVYQATDTKLNRQVALKILPDAFASDPDRLARFQREAQVLASLNHPNIAAIHGLEDSEGTKALVLELVEGPTLADRIAQGPIDVDEALPIAKQIAEALEAAHEAGVIHRDLKPANIKVREDGTVKVLDFGLAKALDTTPEGDPSLSPTLTAAATQMGVIMGTAAYMSPEQARGKPVDKRADIWSFGVVLLEMVTGRRVFEGEDVSMTLSSVLQREPDWSHVPSAVSPSLSVFLRRCLEKDPKQRIPDIAAMRLALEGAFETTPVSTSDAATPQPDGWRQALPWVAGLVLAVVTGVAVWSLAQPDEPRLSRFPLGAVPSPTLATGLTPSVVMSPDGTRVVYVSTEGPVEAVGQLYVREIDQLEAVPLRGAVGINPFFSDDGDSVGFRGAGLADDNLYRVSILGGPADRLSEELNGIYGASWGPDETIVLASVAPGPLVRLSAAGGERQPLTELLDGETAHRWPEYLPGGEAVLFTVVKGEEGAENMEIWVLELTSDQRELLVSGGSNPHYAPTGHLVYGVDGTLRAVPFDLDGLAVTGSSIPVLEGVVTQSSGAAHFSLGQDGSLVYATGDGDSVVQHSLVWVDRQGNEEPAAAQVRDYYSVQLAPDGRRAVAQVGSAPSSDLVVYDLEQGTSSVFTFDQGLDFHPLWARDGERIFWTSPREGSLDIFWKAADGTGQVERLTTSENAQVPASWSADGQTLVMIESRPDTNADVGLLSIDGGEPIEWLLTGDSSETFPDVSPDGRWMAYTTDRSGRYEVIVQPFPNIEDGRWTISQDGGFSPKWGPDGELFFRTSEGAIMMATNVIDPTFSPGTPVRLFDGPYLIGNPVSPRTFDVSPDGQRLLMIKEEGATTDATVEEAEIKIVLNWTDELTRLVPTN
jgi:serine/threonine-protein kinase